MKKKYKTTRKYSCPYCEKKMTRDKLITHVEEEHEMMLPEGYSAARAVYDHINGKNYGTCMVCKAKVYEWDENICRYKNLCDNTKCRAYVQAKARDNHLEDPEVQKKMLAGRHITGQYTFSDGVTHSYTGSYEKNAWEFMDKVCNIKGADLMIPGPVIDYEFEGETHKWILDCLYIPAMLAIDVKDGGKNPNTRPMQSYRDKQIAKEEAIAKQGEYNYLRLTDNNFGQLLSALADIKFSIIEQDPEKGIYINEGSGPSMGGVIPPGPGNYYVVPYQRERDDDIDFSFGTIGTSKVFKFDDDGNLIYDEASVILKDMITYPPIYFKETKSLTSLKKFTEASVLECLLGFPYTSINDFLFSENVIKVSPYKEEVFFQNGIERKARLLSENVILESLVKTSGYVYIMKDMEGYYLVTPDDYLLVSPKFEHLEDIDDNMIKLFNDLYEKNRGGKNERNNSIR